MPSKIIINPRAARNRPMNVCSWRNKVLSNRTYSFRGNTVPSVFATPHEPEDSAAGEEVCLFLMGLPCQTAWVSPGGTPIIDGHALIYQ